MKLSSLCLMGVSATMLSAPIASAATRRLDTLTVDETVRLLRSWDLHKFFGDAFRTLAIDGDLLAHLETDDLFGPESAQAFPAAHTMHKKKLLRKLAQLELESSGGGEEMLSGTVLALALAFWRWEWH